MMKLSTGLLCVAALALPITPAQAAQPAPSAQVAPVVAVSVMPQNAKVWWTKCQVTRLSGEGTGVYVYGKGTDRASAQRKANTFVPMGFKAKHCAERPVVPKDSKILKAGGGLTGKLPDDHSAGGGGGGGGVGSWITNPITA